jgi:hypothetical protein
MTNKVRFQMERRRERAVGSFLPAILALLACASSLQAAIVIVADSEEPILGYAVERSNGLVISSSNRSDAKTTLIPKEKVVEVIPTVSRERLANLSSADPEGCFQYADELFAMHRDPEARETAVRLYLIAGRAAPDKFARGALLSLQRLAPTERVGRRVAAFATANRWMSPGETVAAKEAAEATKAAVPHELLKVLRLLKQGKKTAAARAWKAPGTAEQLERYALRMTSDDMREALEADTLNRRQLARIVALEAAIDSESEPVGKVADESLPWSGQYVNSKGAAIRPLAWEFLFDGIDPRDDQFQDGTWKRSS